MKNNPLEHWHSAAHFFKYKYQANCSIGPSRLILLALYRRRGWGFTASRQTLNEVAALQNYPIDTQRWSNVLDVESTLNWRYFNAVCLLGNLKKCGWVLCEYKRKTMTNSVWIRLLREIVNTRVLWVLSGVVVTSIEKRGLVAVFVSGLSCKYCPS